MISCYAGHCVKSPSKHLHRASDKIIHSIRQKNIAYESTLLVLILLFIAKGTWVPKKKDTKEILSAEST